MKVLQHIYPILFILLLSSCAPHRSTFSKTYLTGATSDKLQVLDSIYLLGNPLITDGEAMILAKSNSDQLSIAGDFNQWNPKRNILKPIPATPYRFFTMPIENESYLEYKLVDEENWYEDPNNPHKTQGGNYTNSLLTGIEYEQAKESLEYDICHGSLDTLSLFGPKLNKEYRIIVYLPCDYDPETEYPYSVFHDGEETITLGKANNTLDYLIQHQQIRSVIGIFITPVERQKEYVYQHKILYADYIFNALLPELREKYSLSPRPQDAATIGASFGGHISVYLAYSRPDIFGKCGALSSSYWPEEKALIGFVKDNMHAEVDYLAIWGTYDGAKKNNLVVNRAFAQKQIPIYTKEYPYGHNWPLWRDKMPEVLKYFFGDSRTE